MNQIYKNFKYKYTTVMKLKSLLLIKSINHFTIYTKYSKLSLTMSLIIPYSAPPPRPFQWTINSSIQLIREHKNANSQFIQLRNSGHHAVWSSIANNIFNTTGLVVTPNQCRTKWNSLKRGYKNLIRIMSNNRRGYPLSSPNSFDEACFGEMSDEFWVYMKPKLNH